MAQATGDFTRAELSKDGKLVLDRQSQALITAAGGDPTGGTTGGDDDNSGGSDTGGTTPTTPGDNEGD